MGTACSSPVRAPCPTGDPQSLPTPTPTPNLSVAPNSSSPVGPPPFFSVRPQKATGG